MFHFVCGVLQLADPDQSHIHFEFECPITELVRVAMLSKTTKDWDNVVLRHEHNDGYLEDMCNGDRYRRLTASVSAGGAILGCIFATDGICMDKAQFDSQDVGALSCAFVRGSKRDRDECVISVCTFGKIPFAGKNKNKVAAKKFKATLEHISLRAMIMRFDAFNEGGGALVPMNGTIIHFERAAIVAVYADLPAAMKVCLTGSACNTCYLPLPRMAEPNPNPEYRTWPCMDSKRQAFLARVNAKDGETATDVIKEAKAIGVDLNTVNAFRPRGAPNVIGPCPLLDNPWSATPPVFLHGMESGTSMKLVHATMCHVIKAAASAGVSSTAACRLLDRHCSEVHRAKPHNTNVELGSHALLPMPHGISGYIHSNKTMDGNKRFTMARLVHGFVATTPLLSERHRIKCCKMFERLYECREGMMWPLHRSELQSAQLRLDEFDA